MGQIWHFNPTYLYISNMTQLIMLFLRLNETCRMICSRYYQIMSTLLKLGLSGYDVKPRFCAFSCEYLLQNPLFLWGKILVALDTYSKKNEPTIDRFAR